MKIFGLFVAFTLISFALSPDTQAVAPAPDGGYPNGNTAEGQNALFSLTTGRYNTAVGLFSLRTDATGQLNTAVGAGTLLANTADENTATGAGALLSNSAGASNTANGAFTLFSNTTGNSNTAIGTAALLNNTNGGGHTAVGYNALATATAGASAFAANTAVGVNALFADTTGNGNTAVGAGALFGNTTGGGNTAIGNFAGSTLTTSHNNIAVGAGAGAALTTGDFNIDIGNAGNSFDSGTIRIGDSNTQFTVIAGIAGVSVGTDAVFVEANGQLGTGVPSSARFKKEIKPMEKTSEAILALKPVTFRYKNEIDPKGTLRFGLVAEEVEKIDPDLVGRDAKGQVASVRYDAVNAMLLNEFLKEHRAFVEEQRKVEKLEATVAKQHKDFEAVVAELKQQIQKVSAPLEPNKPALQTVLTSH